MKMIEMRRTNNNLEHLTKRVRLFYNTLNNIDPRYVKIKFVGIKEINHDVQDTLYLSSMEVIICLDNEN